MAAPPSMKVRRRSTGEFFFVEITRVDSERWEAFLYNGAVIEHMPVKKYMKLIDDGEFTGYNDDQFIAEKVKEVFDYWKKLFMKSDDFKLSPSKQRIIKERLWDGYTAEQLKLAISGVSKSQWHLDNGYVELETILKEAKKVDINIERNMENNQWNHQPTTLQEKDGALSQRRRRRAPQFITGIAHSVTQLQT